MIDIYYEEASKVKNPKRDKTLYNTFFALSILFFVIAAVSFSVFINIFPYDEVKESIVEILIFVALPILLNIGVGVFFFFFRKKFHVEYDYNFTSGTIRISKIIMNNARKLVTKFDYSNIEKIGKVDSETYNQYLSMPNTKEIILSANKTPSKEENFYYIVQRENKLRNILILDCSKTFLINILKYTTRMVLEKDFKWFI